MAQSTITADKPRRGIKEIIRKFFVTLKRNPHNIAMLMMLISFLFYSLNLTSIANTTDKLGLDNMGQCEFVAMLAGILAFVSFLRAFPRREKPKLIMIVLTAGLLALSVFVDIIYNVRINQGTVGPEKIIDISEETKYISTAQGIVSVHIILLIISIALIVLLPVYSKMIRKIKTSIDVAGNDDIAAIDISGED